MSSELGVHRAMKAPERTAAAPCTRTCFLDYGRKLNLAGIIGSIVSLVALIRPSIAAMVGYNIRTLV
jgi:hypothetical protein